jgi:hypothetical protein
MLIKFKSVTIASTLLASFIINALHIANANPYNFSIANTPSRFSYTYMEATLSTDNTPNRGSSYGIGGSYNVLPNVNLLGSYTRTTVTNSDKLLNLFSIGAGYHLPVGPDTDLTANLLYLDEEESITSGAVTTSISDSGASGGVGVRHLFNRFLEGSVKLNFTHVHDSNAKTTLGMRYHYSNQLSGDINYTIDDDDNVAASVRWSF